MKADTVIRKLKLTEAALESIRGAVRDAETRTTGEIALAATGESSDYSFFELFAAVLFGAFAFALTIPLHGALSALVGKFFWIEQSWYTTALSGIIAFGAIALFFAFANVPAVDRLVIPRQIMKRRVYNRALRHFVESGVYATAERTGILVFISCMEHEVRIIADEGIASRIAQEEWDSIANAIATGIRAGKAEEALVAAIARCADILEKSFPAKRENPNELADGLVILEAGE